MEDNSGSPLAFLDFFETSALLLDEKDNLVKANSKLFDENKAFSFFGFSQNRSSYILDKIDKEDWYKHLSISFATGGARFIIKSCFYECTMNRLQIGTKNYVLISLFENKSLKEDVADFFLNDFRLMQLKELSEMAAGIAHEINNPLTVISARTQMLCQDVRDKKMIKDEDLFRNLDKIYKQTGRIKKIVDSMQIFSRNSSQDDRTVYNIKSLVQESFSLVAGGIRDNGIEFGFDMLQNEKYINCKPNELIQVLVNLFNNSIYALSKTVSPKIEVQFCEDAEFYHLYFSDNGPGIPSENDSKIFLPFFTTKPIGAGTGLGLSISNKIIQSYGGTLRLDRARGNSSFHITLSKVDSYVSKSDEPEIFKYSS